MVSEIIEDFGLEVREHSSVVNVTFSEVKTYKTKSLKWTLHIVWVKKKSVRKIKHQSTKTSI
jgi:hypothetical protein